MGDGNWALEELKEGMSASFTRRLEEADIDAFAELSGDRNLLHMDRALASEKGFRDRVVHGAFLGALVSQFVGMKLPGRRSLLLGLKLDFPAPSFPGDLLEVVGIVRSVHPSQRVAVLRVVIQCSEEVRARGTVTVRVDG